ncbi:MAG: protein adenylyltransferase SelO [Aquabacterium sp.]
MPTSPLPFDNTYARELPGLYTACRPAAVASPRSLYFNEPLARELGLDPAIWGGAAGASVWAGNVVPDGAQPLAQAYAGHQFGGFSAQLGDGRALLLGELIDTHGRRRDLALKGSGRTPYSRGGDGKAAVGPMLREVLISEALYALGVPSTRSLAVVATGEEVYRDDTLPGAVLTRVASSHIRVGTFQFFAARGQLDELRRLLGHTVARHQPDAVGAPDRALRLLQGVAERQAALIGQWLNLGFIHGVMNTDNMTISGESIDFGPCAFMEAYDPATVFSSIDRNGRYAYGNQAAIARWNLARLAEALLPLFPGVDDDTEAAVAQASAVIDAFPRLHEAHWRAGQRDKLGLTTQRAEDTALADDWLALMQAQQMDFTLAWRHLATAAGGQEAPLRALASEPEALTPWLGRWRERVASEGRGADLAARLRRHNPWLIPRNHRVEAALQAASDQGDLAPFQRLLAALQQPYDERSDVADLAEPAPAAVTACYRTFCGT